jgi:hypothetical protein
MSMVSYAGVFQISQHTLQGVLVISKCGRAIGGLICGIRRIEKREAHRVRRDSTKQTTTVEQGVQLA